MLAPSMSHFNEPFQWLRGPSETKSFRGSYIGCHLIHHIRGRVGADPPVAHNAVRENSDRRKVVVTALPRDSRDEGDAAESFVYPFLLCLAGRGRSS